MGCSCCPPATPARADVSDAEVGGGNDLSDTASLEAKAEGTLMSFGNGKSCASDKKSDSLGKGDCYGGESMKGAAKAADPSCADACCNGDDSSSELTTAIVTECVDSDFTADVTCKDKCCENDVVDPPSGAKPSLNEGCADSCCDTATRSHSAATATGTPDCCQGKPSPCCDESCLDRLALRECGATPSSSCQGKPGRGKNGYLHAILIAMLTNLDPCSKPSACDRHKTSIRQQYAAKLEALGCICRALLALGQESCCEPRKRPSLTAPRCSRRSSKQSLDKVSIDSCCASGSSSRPSPARARERLQNDGKGCCGSKPNEKKAAVDSCCKPRDTNTPSGTCGSANKAASEATEKGPGATTPEAEPPTQPGEREHVVLSISGMTCTGCETKLNRTLATLAGVKNLKTSLVLSRAEFDVDVNQVTVDQVTKHLERTTEFKCEIIASKGSSVDVVVSGDASTFTNQEWPDGVIDMTPVERNIIRIVFDPEVVGARDLFEGHWRNRIQLAPVSGDMSLAAGRKHVRHVGYMTLASAVLTIPVLVMAWAPIPEREIAYSSASLALATLVQAGIAGPFYPKALKALVFSQVIEMDLLIVLSTSAAYIFSVISFGYLVADRPLSTGQFFETSTLLVTLIMVGRYVAALARQKAVESISIRSLQTPTAVLVDKVDPTRSTEIDARLLQYGDSFKVAPETRIPTDGTVTSGSSEVDESMLTGESLPVEKCPKSRVIAGTINGPGVLIVKLTRLPGDNTLNTIAAMVDEAKLSKPKIQALADKVASYFVPVVVLLTIITFVVWVAVGIKVQHRSASDAAVQAITYAITVLIVSCPCAIGLAVPMVIVIVSGVAAERGVIFKSAEAIEVAHRTSHVVLDKTGTLTQGKLRVVHETCLDKDGDHDGTSLSLLLGLISNSKHPVSVAVADHLRSNVVFPSTVSNFTSLPGRGIEAKVGDKNIRAGNSRWLGVADHHNVQPVLAQGHTVFCFTINGALSAVFGLEDSLRPDAAHVVDTLRQRGICVHIVSGDDDAPVKNIATRLSIPENNVRSRSSPADKQDYITKLLEPPPMTIRQGQHGPVSSPETGNRPVVVFCGDGTNDAIAIAQATIGVHMNQPDGSDVAQSAADVVLMRPALSGLLTMMNASKLSVRRIQFNFAWSFIYNTFAVLLAAGAFVNARIPPEFAGLGELVSVLPVVGAAVLLRWARI